MPRQIIKLNRHQNNQGDAPLGLARQFAAEHREAMINASALLGGPDASRRCTRLIEELRESPTLSRRLRIALVDLHRLLSLDLVDDFETEEARRFSEIHPSDPRVHELCLLADQLRGLLEAIARVDAEVPDVEAYLAASAA